MATIGLVSHHHRDTAIAQGRELSQSLVDAGHRIVVAASEAERVDIGGEVVSDEAFGPGLDLLVSLGGDGSILRAVELVGAATVPILGVNHGEMGYLTAVEPGELAAAVEKVLVGEGITEERMMVQAAVHRGGTVSEHHALNEIVVERGATSTTIRVAVVIDGEKFHTYAADGVIVASPTGSTAYSLSARGPVLASDHRALLLTPVSPHQLFDRSMILAPHSSVELVVEGYRDARLAVDGRTLTSLHEGDRVVCTASHRVARLVTLAPRRFHTVLKTKFGLAER